MIDTKFWLSFLTLIGLFSTTQIVQAQTYQPTNRAPVADNTLGTQVSGAGGNFNITGGVSKGQTLFHSFTDFSVPTSGQANFLNPVSNRDIITRVTGNLFSDINGLVNTNGANFFLINPSGIVFGPNAQLNVGKAFVGSTANSIDLVGGGRTITFGTNPNGDAPLLSVAPNVLFDISRLNLGGGSGSISNFGTLQTPNPNQYIGLIGGNVSLNGGQINVFGGRVELGGLSAPEAVSLGTDINNLRAQFPTSVARGDVSLSNGARVSVVGAGGGDVVINARNVEILGASAVIGGILSGFGTTATVAGDVKVNATEDVKLAGTSAIVNQVEQRAVGTGGGVVISARNLSVTTGAGLTTRTGGQGNAGTVKITATGDVLFDGFNSGVGSTVEQGAVGKGGGIEVSARNLSVTNEAQLQSLTRGQGDAGTVKVTATGDVLFDGGQGTSRSGTFNTVEQGAVGKGGGIEISTRNLSVTNGAGLTASTLGQGDAGTVKVTATGDVLFDGGQGTFRSTAMSAVDKGVVGKGGGVEISARNLFVTNGAALMASTLGQGDAGTVKITATGDVLFDGRQGNFGSAALSTVEQGAVGKGGGVEISARNFSVTNGAVLNASTLGRGDAGTVKITATGDVLFDGRKDGFSSGVGSTVEQGAVGKGGGLEISARNLSVTNGAQLQASTKGQGDAGTVKITATGDVSFNGIKDGFSSGVRSTVEGQGAVGNGGGLEISARNLSVTNGAQLVASTLGQGDAGTVKITATGDVSFDGVSTVFSTVEQGAVGKGGGIEISTRNLSVTNGSGLTASTLGKGDAGTVKITATGDVSFDGSKDGFSSAASSNVKQGGVGKGGGIEISARNLSVTNGAGLAASTIGQGDAGNIFLNANKIILNGGVIGLLSLSSTGGDLFVTTTEYLLLRNNSRILTDSGSTGVGGNGGNITINSPLIIAPPGNNDITANAVQGNGGKVKINSQGLFGIQFRAKGQDSPTTNDITASSTFGRDGAVNISTPGTDPGKDSTELPKVPNDASNQISQVCGANSRQNKLTVTGRGGLPPTANDPLTSDVIWQDARAASPQPVASSAKTNLAKLAAPAVGWVFDGKGKVTLVAAGTQEQPTGTSVVCPQTK
jgi:filamentous hemagglutinin family protein